MLKMNAKVKDGNLEMLKQNVRQKFAEILAAVQMREKLLLRQLDVIATSQLQQNAGSGRCHVTSTTSQQQTPTATSPTGDVKFLAEQETELLASIRSFGRFQLDNMNLALHDVYLKNEDYIEPTDDHETMYKCLPEAKVSSAELSDAEHLEEQPEAIVVDFSRNKSLVEHSRKLMNKSIINITLQEAKELIRKARLKREANIPPLNLEELDDELESSIADALSSLECRNESAANDAAAKHTQNSKHTATTTKQLKTAERAEATTTTATSSTAASLPKKNKTKRCKPKITINNCNGTINLRNIASLTINCASEEAISAEIPLQMQSDDEEEEAVACKGSKRGQKKTGAAAAAAVKKALECIVDSSSTNNTGTTTATTTPTTTASSSNYSSNASSRSQSKKQKKADGREESAPENLPHSSAHNYGDIIFADGDGDDDVNVNATCDFYNRLLNEIKHNLHEKPTRCYKYDGTAGAATAAAEPDSTSFNADSSAVYTCSSAAASHSGCQVSSSNANTQHTLASSRTQHTTATTTTQSESLAHAQSAGAPPPGKRLILKNFENLKIILEANSGDEDTFHPVQIEQWLAEIISETDLEPMPNTDILEHSKLHATSNNMPLLDDADTELEALADGGDVESEAVLTT